MFYKETNSHDYHDYLNHHPEHKKQNMPYNLAKRIIVFVPNEAWMNETLSKVKTCLFSCSYALAIVEKTFFNAELQGPAHKKEEIVISFESTYYGNFNSKSISIAANSLLSNAKDNQLEMYLTNVK